MYSMITAFFWKKKARFSQLIHCCARQVSKGPSRLSMVQMPSPDLAHTVLWSYVDLFEKLPQPKFQPPSSTRSRAMSRNMPKYFPFLRRERSIQMKFCPSESVKDIRRYLPELFRNFRAGTSVQFGSSKISKRCFTCLTTTGCFENDTQYSKYT